MYIDTDDPNFLPANFVITNYYGEEFCFCWTNDRLAIFRYPGGERSVTVVTAPAVIREVKSYTGRIFVICDPKGVYKFSRRRDFVLLSPSALAIGPLFYEVLTVKDGQLYLKNKQTTTSKLLLQFTQDSVESTRLSTLTLSLADTETNFFKVLSDQDTSVEHLCVVAHGRRLFRLVNDGIRIIYSGVSSLDNVLPVQGGSGKIAGLLLLNETENVTVVHAKDERLVFDKVYLGTKAHAICAGFTKLVPDGVWIVYSDDREIYYAKKDLLRDTVVRVRVQNKSLACLRRYSPRTILGLNRQKQLLEFSVEVVEKTVSMENDACFVLQESMLKETESKMEKIYTATQELQALNEELLEERDKLNRINLYSYKRTIQFCPQMTLYRFFNETFLSIDFKDSLPRNSSVICSLNVNDRTVFSVKTVLGETKVELRLPGRVFKLSELEIDLATLVNDQEPWCLIRNCIRDPPENEKKRRTRAKPDKIGFVKTKIAMLQNFIAEGSTDMNKLSEIKRSIRKELGDN